MRLVVATVTCREAPLFKEAADTIVGNLDFMEEKPESLLWLVVDEKLWYPPGDERRASLEAAVGGRFPFLHLAPSPSPVRGPGHENPLPDIGNARNSAIRAILDLAPETDYVLWLDDRSLLSRLVLTYAMQAASQGKCLRVPLRVPSTLAERFPSGAQIVAIGERESAPPKKCPGVTALGGCCGMPLQALVDVNGLDEAYRGEYFTDLELFCRVDRAGYRWLTTHRCCFFQVMAGHSRNEVTPSRRAHLGPSNRKRYRELLNSDQIVAKEGYRRP